MTVKLTDAVLLLCHNNYYWPSVVKYFRVLFRYYFLSLSVNIYTNTDNFQYISS